MSVSIGRIDVVRVVIRVGLRVPGKGSFVTAVVEGSVDTESRSVAELLGSGVEPGSMVWATTVERGPLAGWLVVERGLAQGRERRCAVVMPDAHEVVVAGPISGVRVLAGPIPTDEVMPGWASAIAAAFWDIEDLRAERNAARGALVAKDQRLEEIVDAAHEYADRYQLCERFDEFMLSQDLPARSNDYIAGVNVTVRVRIPVSSYNSDAAGEKVTDEMVREAIYALRGGDLADAIQDHELLDVERA